MRTLMLICFVAALAGRGTTYLYPIDLGTNLPYGRNTSSGPISVPAFPYYGQTVSEVWVFQHGILTFNGENTNPGPGSLPFPTSAGNEGKLLAVFWVEHGSLGDDVSYYTSTDAALLTQASDDVATFFPCDATFTPTNLFVATWDRISIYTDFDCDTTTYTNPHHHTYYYTYVTTYTTYTSTYYCDTYTYVTTYCYSDSYGSSDCTSYPTYTSYCYHTYYTYTYYTTYTTTYTTWYTSTSTTTYCRSSFTSVLENGYQVALATDGTRTFALLCYDKINWGYNNHGYAIAGFNRGDGTSYLVLPGNGTRDVYYYESSSNVGVAGIYAFRVDKAPTDIPCVDCQCHLFGMLEKFDQSMINPVVGPGKQTVTLVERNDGDFCRFRLEATVKLVDGNLQVKHVFFRFGPHANSDKYAVKVTLKTGDERYREGDVETALVMPVDEITSGGAHFKVELIGNAYHVTSTTCNWSFDYDPVADTVDYTGSPVVTTGLCGSCV